MLMNRSSAFIARAGDPPSAFAASLKRYDGRRLVCGDQSGRTFPSSDLVLGRMPVVRSFRGMAYSPRFNMSGSLAIFDATRLASSIVICFAPMASASVERP